MSNAEAVSFIRGLVCVVFSLCCALTVFLLTLAEIALHK